MRAVRISTRLIRNATTSYARMGATFAIGLFSTWYILGAAGVVGFGLIALAFSTTGPSMAIERSIRFGLVRELAAAIATGEVAAIRRSATCAFRLCLQAAVLLAVLVGALAAAALAGWFNIPEGLAVTLAALILAEGTHAAARLLTAPHFQSLFAAQKVGVDNLLIVLSRATYALSAVLVFGWWLRGAPLSQQLIGFAATRVTLQLADVVLGVWLAKRYVPGLRLDRASYDEAEYREIRGTVWHTSQVTVLLSLDHQFLAVLINLFFGLSYNGIWQIALQFGGFARMIADGLARGIDTLATHLQQTGRVDAAIDLMSRSIRYQLAVVVPAALMLCIFARPLLELWVGGRLAGDPNLEAIALSAADALTLATILAILIVIIRSLRAGFYGVERILYGLGKVRSYAWFAKWTTVICLTSAALLMAWLRSPIGAALGMLIAHTLFSPIVVLRAARREAGVKIGETLWRALPRPLVAGSILALALVAARLALDEVTLVSLVALLLASALLYAVVGWLVLPEADERARLIEVLGHSAHWLKRRRGGPSDGS